MSTAEESAQEKRPQEALDFSHGLAWSKALGNNGAAMAHMREVGTMAEAMLTA